MPWNSPPAPAANGRPVVTALTEFNRRRRSGAFVEKFGTFDGFMTQEELRRMREET